MLSIPDNIIAAQYPRTDLANVLQVAKIIADRLTNGVSPQKGQNGETAPGLTADEYRAMIGSDWCARLQAMLDALEGKQAGNGT